MNATSADHRALCPRHAFTDGECVAAGCRDCPGKAEIEAAATRSGDRRLVWFMIAVAFLGFAGSAFYGLSKLDHQLRIERT